MKSTIKFIVVITILLSPTLIFAQIKNAQTMSVKISGNCGMCKSNIEKVANIKNISQLKWDSKTQDATLSYDAGKTSPDEVLKRVALAGYDNEKYLASNEVYEQLHGCCQYDRVLKPVSYNAPEPKSSAVGHGGHDHDNTSPVEHNNNQLTSLFDGYFTLKYALVQSDAGSVQHNGTQLLSSIKNIDMNKLGSEEHKVWMAIVKDLTAEVLSITSTKNLTKQRDAFSKLSARIYELAKLGKSNRILYYQHCPMYNHGKGANWLSREATIKNPYYGAQMLTCGSTVETLK